MLARIWQDQIPTIHATEIFPKEDTLLIFPELWKENQNGVSIAEMENGAWRPLRKCDLMHLSAWMESDLLTWWSHPEHLPETHESLSTYCTPTLKQLVIPKDKYFLTRISINYSSHQASFNNLVAFCLYKPLTLAVLLNTPLGLPSLCLLNCNS